MSSIRWAFNISRWEPTETEFTLASSCLQQEEKNRIGKFIFKKDIKASLAGRLMIRKCLSEYTGVPYNLVEISRDVNGKPIYKDKNSKLPSVSFNVSHHGSFTVFAGEYNHSDIGIDVMKLEYNGRKSLDEYFQVMSRNFSLLEWKNINGTLNTTEQEKIKMFCRNWALKESYVKAVGLGLKIDLCQLNFDIHSDLSIDNITTNTSLYINNALQAWKFEESLLDPLHCVIVALKRTTLQEDINKNEAVFKQLTSIDLLESAIPILPPDDQYTKNFFSKL
ncbi:L-aminoadipate-semialdehyde dehydrogenase-phosphopantetheinyl transferase [Phymastichus coffea]|uniref:L-aminoadipate-semialdehyde dehydrogenase-phosphopantetheinyl transferase n=1 Tax=Phymastichus coffea TaxID=108790 RepID=UPI00273C8B53|nr:L-aminoadipate-semialdehyde dehydrogenase-phosphopantetheinyl transferase [Phymastichus coffea]XP_058810264.1 L-aminoadipate-semialdehyde dehydrogenase-phosphopantetheinyl transferase [Phymastichus coffea]XP_058810273.1 L-aminoadipate-semialdehyde dehydrogenase-phosphopantetheinyl transferase [Phymastichus coffea]XP_058810283.1 L-aminoadipate-semialdehyde dehydrogenase-phosphopantetheinyl transferase [Phymastichus coffea]